MSDFLRSWLMLVVFGGLAVLLVSAFLGLGSLLRPARATPPKLLTYAAGGEPYGALWSQSNIRDYVFALMFWLFDVEAVFICPWATRLEVYGVFGLVEMAIFIFILALGLFYAWRKRLLRWI